MCARGEQPQCDPGLRPPKRRMTLAIFPVGDDLPTPRRRGRIVGWVLLAAAVIGAVVVGQIPAPYVIEQPGPVYNTIGHTRVDSKTVPVLSITGRRTYPTAGALDMLTVNVSGDPSNRPKRSSVSAS